MDPRIHVQLQANGVWEKTAETPLGSTFHRCPGAKTPQNQAGGLMSEPDRL